MRYEDASGAFQASGPIANDDADTLSAGQRGPATGNLITGEGTQYASAGADSAAGAHITAIAGKGGEDTSFSGGKLSIAGEHGRLTVDADGNYSYLANGNVENVRDRFTYTLADSQGNSDTAALIVEIGKTPAVIKANAQQVIVGPDGVVTLPPGVELSDVRVVGRNLVVDLPDGSQMIIIDGAIFVPQLVLDGVEVPATNVAALLIGQEPQPAAGELPPSSGGNFALPPPPLDPGIPLGDLIPPTELDYIPPEPEEVFDTLDEEPEAGAVSAQLDDDARPGGIAGGTGDDPDSVNVNGFLPGSGGDGDLTWSLLLTGAPAGFTYVDGPGESILVQQGGVTVLTITVNPATGEYSIVQNATIDHPAGDNENNVSFTIEYAVTDEDGDVALGTLDINVDDDTPTVDATVASDANVLLTTQDAQTDGDPTETDTASTTADFGGIFGASGAFGADGPGTSSLAYALSTTGGASGLTQHGAAINLYLIGGVVVGSTAASAGAVNASNTVFDISVDGAGVVTLNQYSQIDHTNTDPSPTGPGYEDHLITLADGSVTLTLTASVTDSDGDTVTDTASVGIGANMQFADDGPSIDPTLNEVGGAVVDESEPVEAATIALVGGYTRGDDPHLAGGLAIGKGSTSGPVIDANAIFGADGPANGGGISYQLEVGNLVSGLTTTEGTAINLVELANGVVVGVVDGTTTVAFAIAIDSNTGVVTVEQYLSLFHPDSPDNFDEPVFLNEGSLGVTVTATDFDGDSVTSEAVDITSLIRFEDDGPSASGVANPAGAVTVDESGPTSASTIEFTGAEGDDDDVAGSGPIGRAVGVAAVVDGSGAFGADGPAAEADLTYALALGGSDTALTLTDGSAIELQLIDGVIVGVVTEGPHDGDAAFAIAINPNTGVATVELYLSLDHPDVNNPNDSLPLGPNTVDVVVTATDGDGDSDESDPIDISGLFNFLDDGPSVEGEVDEQGAVTVDESGPTGASTIEFTGDEGDDEHVAGSGPIGRAVGGTAVVNANALFGADGPSGDEFSYALALGGSDTALTLTDGSAIQLQLIDGVIVGVVTEGPHDGEAAFAIAIDSSTGIATVEMYLSLDHPDITNHNDSLPLGPNTVDVVVTATDGDGDSADSDPVDISGLFNFLDDGPSVDARLSTEGPAIVDESPPVAAPTIDTGPYVKGDDPDLVGGQAIGSGSTTLLVPDADFGADGPAADDSLTFELSVINPSSGLTLTDGSAINLVLLPSGVVVGVVSGGAFNGQAAFAISIDSNTGTITAELYLSLDHPTNPDPNDVLTLAAGSLGAIVTATDGDGDTATSGTIDVGSMIQFLDDGPSASNEPQQDVQEGNQTVTGTFDFIGGADGATVTHINGIPLVFGVGGFSQWIPVDDGQIRAQADGDYEFQSDASGSGVTNGTFTVTDGDGDPVTANWAFNITDANAPTAGVSAARLDDDGLAGGNPASTTGDIDANVGEIPVVNPEEDIFHGQLTLNFGGDGPGTVTFAAMHGDPGVVGTENVIYSWNGGTSTLTATVVGGPRDGTLLFDIVVNQTTGEYTLTLRDNVIHAAGGDEASAPNVALTYTVTDSDNSPAGGVNGTLNITFNDDGPTINVTQTNESGVVLTTQDAQTDGDPTPQDTDVTAINFGGVFGLTSAAGADGGSATPLAFDLNVTAQNSGLTSHGLVINLFEVGGVIYGTTAGVAPVDATTPGVVFSLSVSNTGVVTLTQYQQVDHPIGADPDPTDSPFDDHFVTLVNGKITLTASSTITDGDGDQASDQEVVDLGGNIRFADDGPDAVNDNVAQATENTAVVINVFANDLPGADGVNVVGGIAVVPGSLTGAGNLVYNNNGTFTYTPAPGEEANVTFQYQITDFDGDTDIATVTIDLQPDSTPSAVDGVAKVDDDGLPAGVGDNASGDLDANSGEAVVVNPSEAIWHGQLVATAGGDTIVDYDFSSMHGTSGSVGTETVNYTWNNASSTLTATISGGARNGLELFNVVVNQSTGSYNLTLVRPVAHVDEVANQENDATTNLTFTVTDSDGDTDTGLVTVTFDDDMPVVTAVTDPLEIPNSGPTPNGTGNFAFDIGADQNADFDDISVSNFTILINGNPATNVVLTPNVDGSGNPAPETATTASYRFTFQYDTGVGGLTNGVGTLVFNKATGEYTVSLTSGPIEGFTILETGSDTTTFVEFDLNGGAPDVVTAQLATNLFAQFTAESTNNNGTPNLLTTGGNNTAWNPGELFTADPGNPQVSSTDAGVDGNTMDTGEVLDFNLFTSNPGSNTALTPDGFATEMFIQFFQFTANDDIIVVLKLQDADNPLITTTRAIIIDGDDVFLDGDSAVGTSYEGLVNGLGSQDALVVIQSNDYNAAGENWVIVGAQIVTDNDGTSGTGVNLDGDLGPGGASDRDQDGDFTTDSGNAALDELSTFADDTDVSGLKITSIGFLVPSTEAQSATIEFDVTIEDSDGDQVVTQDITVQIGDPVVTLAAESTSFSSQSVSRTAANDDFSSLLAGDTSQKWNGGGNSFGNIGNTGITSAMVAASGLSLMSTTSLHGFNEPSFDAMMQDSFQQLSAQIVGREGMDDGSISTMSFGGGYEPTLDTVSLSGSGRGFNETGTVSNMLDSQAFGDAAPAYQPTYAVNQVADFGSASFAAPAPVVGMPSAQALQLAGLDGNVQNGGAIEQVLADALGGAPTLDAILANLPGGIGELAAIANLASPDGQAVPGWDMALNGAFGSGAEMVFKADAVALHHDAVQPIA